MVVVVVIFSPSVDIDFLYSFTKLGRTEKWKDLTHGGVAKSYLKMLLKKKKRRLSESQILESELQ